MEYTFADMYKDSPKSIRKNNLLWGKNNRLHLLQSKNTKKRRTSSNQKRLRTENIKFLQPISKNSACGEHSVDTKSEIVKILHVKQFYKHYVFNEDGDGGRKKVLKNYIDVYVCIDMVCGDTKGELGS